MKYLLLFSLVFFLSIVNLYSEPQDINFRRVSPSGGYSFQAVSVINQDVNGYIWMGSFDGVLRYDSKEIVRFTYNPNEPEGLPSNTITSIVISDKNDIWVSTDQGLCLFNHNSQKFERVFYTYENGDLPGVNIYSTALDGDGNLWIADKDYFGYLDREKKQLVRMNPKLTLEPRLLYNDAINRMWLGTNDGSVYLVKREKLRVIKKVKGLGSFVRAIFTNNDDIWVGCESHGARLYDRDGNLKHIYSYPKNPELDIKNASVRKIWRDTRGKLWIGSYYGLFVSEGTELIHYSHDEYEELPHNSIFTLFEDKQGSMWIGTWSGGVAYQNYSDNRFANFRYSKDAGSISDNMVSSFVQSPNGDFYVGTEMFGLNKYVSSTSSFVPIQVREDGGTIDIKALEVDDDGGLWVASAFSGVYYRPAGEKKFKHFYSTAGDGARISGNHVYALCKSDSGMWIGTSKEGLNFYDFRSKEMRSNMWQSNFLTLKGFTIRTISIDDENNMWLSTQQGVCRINMQSGDLTHFNIDSSGKTKTRCRSFYFAKQMSDGKIWMGTSGEAVTIYNPETDRLSFFDADGLLKGNDVYGIIEGSKDEIWITSNSGLVLYNTKNKSSRRFEMIDGIQGNQFNPNAIYKDAEGFLYFGGTNGFTRLANQEIKINPIAPNVLINEIIVNEESMIPQHSAINEYEGIVLHPSERIVSFSFSADNYLLPEKNRFKYRLANYIDDWVQDGNNGSVTFVNIKPGKYIFEVLACNNDGVWSEVPTRLPVVVNQYWYKSSFAYLLYTLFFLMLLFLANRIHLERLRLKKALMVETIERENEEHLNEMKLRFFTNVSHEFRTPLTLIDGPIKQLVKADNLTEEQHKLLDVVRRNSNRLLTLINQIMDLRKMENGLSKLIVKKIELVDFISERILSFSEEAVARKVTLTFDYFCSACEMEGDEEKIDKIIYNLLSNAFKYISENEQVQIILQKGKGKDKDEGDESYLDQVSFGELDTDDYVEIIVQDTGQGIDSQDMPNIFNRFEQSKRKKVKNSTGIGLNLCKDFILMHRGVIIVQSTPGKGTRFTIQLPTKQKAQKIMYESHEKVKNIDSWDNSALDESGMDEFDESVEILIVEDNADLRSYIVSFLKDYYSVFFAENGKLGLEVIKKHNIKLVVSDVMMAEMDGFEFCQTIKSQIETSHIPVIMLTALSSVDNKSMGLDKGADAYIMKPFDEKILLSQIRNLLQQRKRLQESYSQRFIVKQPIDVGSLDNYFLNKVNAIINKNIQNKEFSVDFLASEMGFSRSQLHRKLKQITNHYTSEYITMVRIKKAIELLSTKNYNIDEVAFLVGFNSSSYFSKCFRKIHGLSPKEFVKSL